MNRRAFDRLGRAALLSVVLATLAACAPSAGPYVPSPEEIPALEARVRTAPTDAAALTRLGAAYHAQGRLDEAAGLLERARAANPNSANAAFLLGAVEQERENADAALDAYSDYLSLSPGSPLASRVEARVRLVRRAQLRADIREALAMESSLAESPTPATVAVFPFRYSGGDETLRPLGRALAEMLATDLSQTDRLTVLERVHIQALMDEVALGASGAVDASTAARGGRLLGAGRVVQGQLTGNEDRLRVEAGVVRVGAGTDPASVVREDAGARFFDTEKEIAFGLYEEMGVPLSPAERERVNQRHTENLQAILAYGRGLQEQDAGRYAAARAEFEQAAALDPGFELAADAAVESGALVDAETTASTDFVGDLGTLGVETVLDAEIQAVLDQASIAGTRDPAQEVLGTEGVGVARTPVILILRRPGGDR